MNPYRGRGGYPNRGGRGRGYPLIQHGKNLLIAENIASQSSTSNVPKPGDPLYAAFQEFLKTQKDNSPSYSKVISEEDNDDSSEYILTPHKDLIILLEEKDIMMHFENNNNDPWDLFSKYLETASYAACSYKSRNYYENILISTGTCEISHFSSGDKKVYNFSKAIFKKIISAEEWGLSTLREREFLHPEQKIMIKFNFWDYIDSFHKAFLYENSRKKHSWFFKICDQVYKQRLPNWFVKWWTSYGPSVQILPEPFKSLYVEWLNVAPKYKDAITHSNGGKEVIPSLHFFIEFSIPWIWKWMPEVNYSPNQFPSLQRSYLTKFWAKMLQKDPNSDEVNSKQTIDNINQAILKYKSQKEYLSHKEQSASSSPYEKILSSMKAQGNSSPSKDEVIRAYFQQMKEDLLKNFDKQKSDSSMLSTGNEDYLAGESQPLDDEDEIIEDFTVEDAFSTLEDIMMQKIKKKNTKE